MSLNIYTNNQLERLSQELARALSRPLKSPFDSETILTQSSSMQRWISMELARMHGVSANVRFFYPNSFIDHVFHKAVPGTPEKSPYDIEVLKWRIMKLLPLCIKKPGFDMIENYLDEDDQDLRNYQLSEQIAHVFDRYVLFRPEMIFKWEKGKEDHWQADLWRELIRGYENMHRAGLLRAFYEKTTGPSFDRTILPERISVFGISALPRFHMDLFSLLSELTEVNLFFMNPCKEFWGDIKTEPEIKKTQIRENATGFSRKDLYLEQGNSLLASMGKLGRNFFDLITEYNYNDISLFEQPGEESILTSLQSDILNLHDRETGETVLPDDNSIQIHSCHSPMREIEILYDNLLFMFEKDPELKPEEIVVMIPDIDTYAPYVQAVFATAEYPAAIPFSIADQSAKSGSHVIETFLAILDLAGSRFRASDVLALFDSQAVRRKFGLSADDMNLIMNWTVETNIKWGIDSQSKSRMSLPGFHDNTWRSGLDRLLLGYAMAGQDRHMFSSILPYDNIEGQDAEILGKFLNFSDKVFNFTQSLSHPQTLIKWFDILGQVLDIFFEAEEDAEREIQAIRQELDQLADMQDQNTAGFDNKLDFSVIRHHLGKCFKKDVFGFGFFTRGVTFCAMLPMRVVPFKVVCLVGMNNGLYPRQDIQPGFDFIAKNLRPGDRSRRDDDRYLFLESILSAREKLYISYTGQSIIDNSVIPPSVLVSELIDYIETGFKTPEGCILDTLLTHHHLQAFSPSYYLHGKENTDERLLSYSQENFEAASCMFKSRKYPKPFITSRLPDPEEEWKTIDIAELFRFFINPAQYLLNRRLGIFLDRNYPAVEDAENFIVQGLDKYQLEQKLIKEMLSGGKPEDCFPLIKSSGQLPHGAVGESVYKTLAENTKTFVEKISQYIQDEPLTPLDVNLEISDFRLKGKIGSIYPKRMFQYRMSAVKPKDMLRLWISHLALNTSSDEGYPKTSMLAGLGAGGHGWTAWEFLPVENSREILDQLLIHYWEGLSRNICFFPKTSLEYARLLTEENKQHEDAIRRCSSTWTGSDYKRGEREDPYFQLCYGDTDPFDSEFAETAIEIYDPMLAAGKEIKN